MWIRRAAGVAAIAAGVVASVATPAFAVDEIQFEHVSCTGLRISQQGLPSATTFEVLVIDPVKARVLLERDVRTDGSGMLRARLPVALDGLSRVDVEVESPSGDDEYGEAGTDLHLPCTPKSASPSAVVTAGPEATHAATAREATSETDGGSAAWLPFAVAGAVATVAGGAVLAVARRRRRPAG
jgi:hypothetical protein